MQTIVCLNTFQQKKHVMIKKTTHTLLWLCMLLITAACNDKNIDNEYPVIDLNIPRAFPTHCSDTLFFGESFVLKVGLSDNMELGSSEAISVNIHHNFDHHSHTTEVIECKLEAAKTPINPYLTLSYFDIPEGLQEYVTNYTITIPEYDDDGPFDEGDYHFQIKVIDKSGWSTMVGIGVKLSYRH